MSGTKSAVGEILQVVGGAFGMGDPSGDGGGHRRGAAQLVLQTIVLAAVLALFVLVRGYLYGGSAPMSGRAWQIGAALLTLPMVVHLLAGPPRRVLGAVAGFAVAALGVVAALVLVGALLWPAFGLVVAGFVAGGAVYGAISPLPAREPQQD